MDSSFCFFYFNQLQFAWRSTQNHQNRRVRFPFLCVLNKIILKLSIFVYYAWLNMYWKTYFIFYPKKNILYLLKYTQTRSLSRVGLALTIISFIRYLTYLSYTSTCVSSHPFIHITYIRCPTWHLVHAPCSTREYWICVSLFLYMHEIIECNIHILFDTENVIFTEEIPRFVYTSPCILSL